MAGVQVLLGGEDRRALREGPHPGNRRDSRLGAGLLASDLALYQLS